MKYCAKNSQIHTSLTFGTCKTWGPWTLKLREQWLANDGENEERIAFFNLDEGPNIGDRLRVGTVGAWVHVSMEKKRRE